MSAEPDQLAEALELAEEANVHGDTDAVLLALVLTQVALVAEVRELVAILREWGEAKR